MQYFKTYIEESIANKNVIVSGGTTGIGREIAISLATLGANVVIFGRHQEQIDETIEQIKSQNPASKCFGLLADLTNPSDIATVFKTVDEQVGQLHILINNAGLAFQSIAEGSYEDWEYIVKTNLLGYMACTHEALNRMKQQGGGHIVSVGSMSADVREKDSSVYVATKSGIQGFTEALRKEVNELGIKVSLIEPGAVDTDMQEFERAEKDEKIENMEMLKATDIAFAVVYCLAQAPRTAIVDLKIKPLAQII